MNPRRLPYLLPWVKIHILIRSITKHTWPEDQWPIVKSQLRRAIEIRGELIREAWRAPGGPPSRWL